MIKLKKTFTTMIFAVSVFSLTIPASTYVFNDTVITAEAATKSEKNRAKKKLKSLNGLYDDGTFTFSISKDSGAWGFDFIRFGVAADVNSLASYKNGVMTFKTSDASYKLKIGKKSMTLYSRYAGDSKYSKLSTFKYSTREK